VAIDTGSNRTWIAQDVVDELGLSPVREETAHGSGGRTALLSTWPSSSCRLPLMKMATLL
jgi:hypothetical protein